MKKRSILAAAAALAVALTGSGCAGSGGGVGATSSRPITLGTSLPLTGPLAPLGQILKVGYDQAIADLNADGGLAVGGSKRSVNLVVLDNRSDPSAAGEQTRELILKDGVSVVLGGATPPITVPQGLVAEQQRVPYVTSATPTGAFLYGNPAGWKYGWAFFWSEPDIARAAFAAAGSTQTNKRVALFTDNEADGVVERPLFKQAAKSAGYEVVGDYTFPVGSTDFSSFIADAKAKGAEVVVAQVIAPDGIALVKQMNAMGFQPKAPVIFKAAATSAWPQALGALANGTMAAFPWSPSAGRPKSQHLSDAIGPHVTGAADVGNAVIGYTVVEVVADAITRAGSTDPAAINAALATTDGEFALAHIKFAADHTATTPLYNCRWQDGAAVLLGTGQA